MVDLIVQLPATHSLADAACAFGGDVGNGSLFGALVMPRLPCVMQSESSRSRKLLSDCDLPQITATLSSVIQSSTKYRNCGCATNWSSYNTGNRCLFFL